MRWWIPLSPIIERLGDRNVSIFVWEDFNDPWVEAFDIVDGNLSNHVVREGEIFVDKPICMNSLIM